MAKKKFSLKLTGADENVSFLKVQGVIDEDNHLARALRKIEGDTVVIDLSGVDRINSCGVRDWVNWLNDLHAAGKRVILIRCSPCIVNQLNLVNNFVGGGMVKSFFAPYYCERCDKEEAKLLQVESFAGMTQPRAPAVRGEGCSGVKCEMAFDDIEDAYFAFLPRNTGRVVDPKLQQAIESLSPSVQDRIKALDSVRESEPGEGGTYSSGMYSPLTATGISVSRDSLNMTPAPEAVAEAVPLEKQNTLGTVLTAVAFALVGGIIAYVVFVIGGK